MATNNPQDTHLYINEDLPSTNTTASNETKNFPVPPPPPSNVIPVDGTNTFLPTSTGTAVNSVPTNLPTPPSINVTSVDETKISPSGSANIAAANKPINLQATPSNKPVDAPLNSGATSVKIATTEDTTDPKLSEDAALIDSLKKLEDTLKDPKTKKAFEQTAIFAVLCGSVCALIVLGIASIIPRKLFSPAFTRKK